MKKIGITQRVDYIDSREELCDGLDQRLSAFILECGFYPIPIPNVFYTTAFQKTGGALLTGWLDELNLDGFVLSGGNDAWDDTPRNETELKLLEYARAKQSPVLGICHGMQIMARFAKTPLIKIKNHVSVTHVIYEEETSRVVNSYHQYALAHCPNEFTISATALDGSIERITHELLPWEGWMWHPEREEVFALKDIHDFKSLMNKQVSGASYV